MRRIALPRRHGDKWQINYTDETGKRRWKSFKTKKAARVAVRRLVNESEAIRSGAAVRFDLDRTFTELAELWAEVRWWKRTLRDDECRLRLHLLPALGDLRLTDITPQRIVVLERELRGKMSIGTVRLVLSLLRAMLNLAVEHNWLLKAPSIRLPRQQKKPYRWLKSPEEYGRLLLAARDYGYPGLMTFYATALYTGMRAGELCGLHWSDVDFGDGLITVQRSFNGPTKTNTFRHVPIQNPLMPMLVDWNGVGFHTELVFPNTRGKMHTPGARVMTKIFHSCLKRAEVERLRFHDLRHTFASHWMRSGGDIYKLQKILGHANLKTTEQYAHLSPADLRESRGRLEVPVYDNPDRRGKVIAFPAGLKRA